MSLGPEAADEELFPLLCSLEKRLLCRVPRSSAPDLEELFADDFVEFGSSGTTYTRTAVIAALVAESLPTMTASDLICRRLSREVCLVTYRSSRQAEDSVEEALRSSVWVWRDGRWRIVFHQGVRIR